ncbi:hypothetical protein FQZ97_988270 [compost metagenome]
MGQLFLHHLLHVAGIVDQLQLIVFLLVELLQGRAQALADGTQQPVTGVFGLGDHGVARGLQRLHQAL